MGAQDSDACPAARWMERKRSCLQNQSQNLSQSQRKLSEWPWGPEGPASIIASLLDGEPPEVRARARSLCWLPRVLSIASPGAEEGPCEREERDECSSLPPQAFGGMGLGPEHFPCASSQSSSSSEFWLKPTLTSHP